MVSKSFMDMNKNLQTPFSVRWLLVGGGTGPELMLMVQPYKSLKEILWLLLGIKVLEDREY